MEQIYEKYSKDLKKDGKEETAGWFSWLPSFSKKE